MASTTRVLIPLLMLLSAAAQAPMPPASPAPAYGVLASNMLVVAYLPYWTITGYEPGGGVDLIIFFDAPVSRDGSVDESRVSGYYDEIVRVNNSCGGCVEYVALTCFDPDDLDYLLAYSRDTLVSNAARLAETYGFRGVNLDFEGLRDTNSYTGGDNTVYLISLLSSLRAAGLNVSIAVSGGLPTVYRDSGIAAYIDYVFMMGYDYHWSTSPTTGPVSPFMSTEYDIDDSLAAFSRYYPRDKIVLGLPLYGYDWPASSPDPYAETSGAGTARTLREIKNAYAAYGILWDDTGHVPWIRYVDGGSWRQIWFDNTTSLAMKIDYARLNGYGGYGFWALGYEDGCDETGLFWSMVESRKRGPYIARVVLNYTGGGYYALYVEDMVNIDVLNITISFTEPPGMVNASFGDIAYEFDERRVVENGLEYTIALSMEGFPGIGVSGTGLVANISIEPVGIVENVSVAGGARRIQPGGVVVEPASVGETVVEQPPPGVPEPLSVSLLAAAAAALIAAILLRGRGSVSR